MKSWAYAGAAGNIAVQDRVVRLGQKLSVTFIAVLRLLIMIARCPAVVRDAVHFLWQPIITALNPREQPVQDSHRMHAKCRVDRPNDYFCGNRQTSPVVMSMSSILAEAMIRTSLSL